MTRQFSRNAASSATMNLYVASTGLPAGARSELSITLTVATGDSSVSSPPPHAAAASTHVPTATTIDRTRIIDIGARARIVPDPALTRNRFADACATVSGAM